MPYIENLLLGICKKLQLQESLYDLATERYETIASIIQEDDAFNNIELHIYPQGSFKLKTTVKPLKGNEFDLDFVAELPQQADMSPRELYDNIFRILSSDGIHNKMVEKKSRCVRINYANDFHMDIMPGQAISCETTEIIVPDRELKRWYHHSNPLGYAEWFETQARKNIWRVLCEQGYYNEGTDPVEDQEFVGRLEPLRRAVQLIKRYRDIYCDKNAAEPVRSIVICTMMGEIRSNYSSEVEIITDFCAYANQRIRAAHGRPFQVKNPVVDEILTEKWNEDRQIYDDFVDMIASLTNDIDKLKNAQANVAIIMQAKRMFGENVTTEVVKEAAAKLEGARKTGMLAVGATGILSTNNVGTAIRRNTFYGE